MLILITNVVFISAADESANQAISDEPAVYDDIIEVDVDANHPEQTQSSKLF